MPCWRPKSVAASSDGDQGWGWSPSRLAAYLWRSAWVGDPRRAELSGPVTAALEDTFAGVGRENVPEPMPVNCNFITLQSNHKDVFAKRDGAVALGKKSYCGKEIMARRPPIELSPNVMSPP